MGREEKKEDKGLSEEEKEELEEVLNRIDQDIQTPPYNSSKERGYSREFKKFKKDEEKAQELTRYEKFCYKSASLLKLEASEETKEKLDPAIKLLNWEITPGMVMSATVVAGLLSMLAWFSVFAFTMITGLLPTSLVLINIAVPIGATVYIYYLPTFAAKNKVIRSSGEMILSILYMVIYMRSSPNLEGAIRFAALNLDGPISRDLKTVLWNVESGRYNSVSESLKEYTERWKKYNKDYIESLNLLRASLNESNPDRRNDFLKDAIDNILDGTHEKMKHYSQNLETPVMIINAMGALLPVLGMIMLPLVSAFLGGIVKPIHLIVLFNLMLPSFLWVFMQKTLSSRPPTVSSKPSDESNLPNKGKYKVEILGRELQIPAWTVGLTLFLLIASYGLIGYFNFPKFAPVEDVTGAGSTIFVSNGSTNNFLMLLRSITIVLGLGVGIGATKVLGYTDRLQKKQEIQKMEQQFPNALFELGNSIAGGTPIEIGLKKAGESTDDLEISNLFYKTSDNIRNLGMTFEEAVFDERYGALQYYPSKTIQTVMRAIESSSEKGTKLASEAMLTIARYLENIHQTQEQLNDLMEDTTTTIQMLAYMLAPIISGVAVGMSQTIINALFSLGQTFSGAETELPSGGGPGIGGGGPGLLEGLSDAIPPEVLQFVVGIYLIQLLFILGVFYTKITKGEDEAYKNMFTGKIMITGIIFYALTAMLISMVFGGLVSGVTSGL